MRLILDNVTKKYPGRKVFENISVEAEQGEILIITGPNGSGKTTLINIISSVVPKSSGEVVLEYNNMRVRGAELMPYISLVSPDLYLYDELTASENLRFFAKVSGSSQRNFDDELARFGLGGRGDDLIRSFSSGMKQRMKYILALLKNPALLLLDEPSANLDKDGKALIWDIIQKREEITIIATNESDEIKYGGKTIELGK